MTQTNLFGENERTVCKRCARCGSFKPLSEYNYHTDDNTHAQAYCRQCQKDYAREHSTGGRVSVTTHTTREHQQAYGELYARYKAYRLALDSYTRKHPDPTDRLSFEYNIGL